MWVTDLVESKYCINTHKYIDMCKDVQWLQPEPMSLSLSLPLSHMAPLSLSCSSHTGAQPLSLKHSHNVKSRKMSLAFVSGIFLKSFYCQWSLGKKILWQKTYGELILFCRTSKITSSRILSPLSELVFGNIQRWEIRERKLKFQKENVINSIIKAFELFCVVKSQYPQLFQCAQNMAMLVGLMQCGLFK